MESRNSVQFNYEVDPSSVEGRLEASRALTRNGDSPSLTYSVPISDPFLKSFQVLSSTLPSFPVPTFNLSTILQTENFNRKLAKSKAHSRSTPKKLSKKYVILNAGKGVKDQAQILREEKVEALCGKRPKIVLERLDKAKEVNSRKEKRKFVSCYRTYLESAETASVLPYPIEFVKRIIKVENDPICEEDSQTMPKFNCEKDNDNFPHFNGNDAAGSEVCNTQFPSVTVKVEADWDKPETKLESINCSSVSSPVEQENDTLCNERENKISSVSYPESTLDYLFVPVKSETSPMCEGTIEDCLESPEEIVPEAKNEEIEENELRISSACPVKSRRKQNLKREKIVQPGDELFSCADCPAKFLSDDELNDHLREHVNETSFAISLCSEDISGETSPNKPIGTPSLRNLFTCSQCNANFFREKNLIGHLRLHSGEKPFECTYCHKKFSSSSNLNKHSRRHTSGKPFSCNLCDLKFYEKHHLDNHLRRHDGVERFECTHCNLKYFEKTSLVRHIKTTHTGLKPFACVHCSRRFRDKSDLKKHMTIHSDLQPLTDTKCDTKVLSDNTPNNLISTSTGLKPFACTFCSQVFSNKGCLSRHNKKHTDGKPFECDHCGTKFSQKSSRERHIKTQALEEPIKCSYCAAQFSFKCHLEVHIKTHMSDKPFKCSHCNATFYRKTHLDEHIMIHSGTKPFKCPHCNGKFSRKSYLKVHIRNLHSL